MAMPCFCFQLDARALIIVCVTGGWKLLLGQFGRQRLRQWWSFCRLCRFLTWASYLFVL